MHTIPKNHSIHVAIKDLKEAIEDITLGSVEYVVIEAAVEALINNWNDHNPEEPI